MEVGKLGTTTTEKIAGETCVVCEEVKNRGIYVYMAFICESCERELVQTDIKDEKYKYFLKQLRSINNRNILL